MEDSDPECESPELPSPYVLIKQASDSAFTQAAEIKIVDHICHRIAKYQGLESNQHDPKVTSPSSYKASQSKFNCHKDLSKAQNQEVPKKVSSKPEDGPNEGLYLSDDLSEIIAICNNTVH